MPEMRLYYSPGSSSLASHIALIETGLPFEAVRVDEHTKAMDGGGDYRQVHRLGYVPALLLDDGTLLTEGAAILQHVAELAPGRNLVPPAGMVERARLQAWLNFLSSEVHKGGFSPLFNPAMPEAAKRLFRDRLALRWPTWTGTSPRTSTCWHPATRSLTRRASWSRAGPTGWTWT
jgi:glutathione S-transferase